MRQADLKTKPFSETTELESSRIFGPLPRSPKVPVPPPSCVCSGGVQGARLCPVSAGAGCRVPASTSLQKQRGAGRPPPSCVRRGRVQGARVLVPSGPVVPAGLSGQSGDFNRNAGFSTGGWNTQITRTRKPLQFSLDPCPRARSRDSATVGQSRGGGGVGTYPFCKLIGWQVRAGGG